MDSREVGREPRGPELEPEDEGKGLEEEEVEEERGRPERSIDARRASVAISAKTLSFLGISYASCTHPKQKWR
jgi:hypothetical protein